MMKQNPTQKNNYQPLLGLLFTALLATLLIGSLFGRSPAISAVGAFPVVPEPQAVPMRPWTAVGSSGAVDESSLNLYAFGSPDIGFKAGTSGGVVTARYNVTNTFDNNANPSRPGWHTLEMGSNAPTNTIIEAKLFMIKACGVEPVLLCATRNRSSDHPCATCTFNATIDFTSLLYYVEVTLDRQGAPSAMPRMYTLRVY
jgi:hypothetical protein